MRKRAMLVFGCVAGLLTVAPSTAQAQDFKPVHVSLGGGWTAPNSEVADRLGQGYNFNFGVDVAVNPVVAIEGLYSFNGLGEKRDLACRGAVRRLRDHADGFLRQHEHAVRHRRARSSSGRKAASGHTAWSAWASTTVRWKSPRPASAGCLATAIRGGTSAIPAAGSRWTNRRRAQLHRLRDGFRRRREVRGVLRRAPLQLHLGPDRSRGQATNLPASVTSTESRRQEGQRPVRADDLRIPVLAPQPGPHFRSTLPPPKRSRFERR